MAKKQKELKIGDPIVLRLGNQTLNGIVIEHRGPLGVGGEQIIRIRVFSSDNGDDEPDEFEVPANALAPA